MYKLLFHMVAMCKALIRCLLLLAVCNQVHVVSLIVNGCMLVSVHMCMGEIRYGTCVYVALVMYMYVRVYCDCNGVCMDIVFDLYLVI